MAMTRLGALTAAAMVFFSTASSVSAEPRDSVDRGDRLDRDAIRDDVRIDRLKVPYHPLTAEPIPPPQQPQQPSSRSKSKRAAKPKNSGDVR